MGGYDGFDCLRSIEKVDLDDPKANFVELQREQSLISPLKNSANVLFDDKVYIVGGWDERDTLKSVFCFEP